MPTVCGLLMRVKRTTQVYASHGTETATTAAGNNKVGMQCERT